MWGLIYNASQATLRTITSYVCYDVFGINPHHSEITSLQLSTHAIIILLHDVYILY